ncbi:YfhO family protein [Aggregicoccus sp. 17bor-14]|uniref:YfhO family protein n=1 Tax=Myxococcaceae TaxID=31 RepID=UPI00129CDCA8|nr:MULTISPECIES: YfhO family protein [Myxococcaceae]MBF5044746.1 YfhO family protein [Simulacricoccus sp. 17bor-14]MRI90490.1 YfhO family protein [Aggregicoccus sp. 17bor-14]
MLSSVRRLSPKAWGAPLGLCLLASAALFGATLVGARSFFYRDVLHYYWPTHEAMADAWRALELPLWNPSVSAGLPLLADLHAATLYPPNLLSLWLPFPLAYAWLLVFHHVLGGLGVFAFLRRLTGDGGAAAGGALAWMLSGYVIGLSYAGPLMAGAAYVPWVLLVLASTASWLRRSVVLALLCALQALSGDPQSVLYSLLAGAAFCGWNARSQRGRAALVLGVGLTLAGLLAAVQLWPAWLLLKQASRGVNDPDFYTDWMLHPLRLAELFLPLPFGGYLEEPQFWAWFTVKGPSTTPFALSAYLGASSLVLAVLGLSRRREVGLGLSLLLTGLLLSMASHAGLGWVHARLPGFNLFRYPEKYLLLASFGWAVLVALGLQRVGQARALPRARTAMLVALAAGLLLAWLGSFALEEKALALSQALLAAVHVQAPGTVVLEPARAALQAGGVFVALALLSVAAARRLSGRPLLRLLPVLVLAVDLLLAGQRIVWTEDPVLYSLRSPLREEMVARATVKPFRFFREAQGLAAVAPGGRTVEAMGLARAWELMTLKSNVGTVYGLDELGGYGAVQLQRDVALYWALATQEARLLDALNGCYLVEPLRPDGPPPSEGFRQVEAWPDLRVQLLGRTRCVPRIHGVNELIPVASLQEAVARIRDPLIDLSTQALVEGAAGGRYESVTLKDPRFGRGRAEVLAQVPPTGGFVVFASSYHPGWRAEIDGVAAAVFPVNVATLGVQLPPGQHRLTFHFVEPGLLPGALGSLLGALVAALAWWRGRRPSTTEGSVA